MGKRFWVVLLALASIAGICSAQSKTADTATPVRSAGAAAPVKNIVLVHARGARLAVERGG